VSGWTNICDGFEIVYIKYLQTLMELKLSDKTLRKILIGVAIVAVIILIVNGLVRRSRYTFPTSGTAQEDTTLNTQLQTCQTAYSQAIAAGTAEATAQGTLKTCVSGKVSTYVQTKCPYTNGIQPGATGGGPATTDATAAWTAYQANIGIIRNAYTVEITAASATPADAAYPLALVQAARKADLTGATRQYLATVCPSTTTGPGFYTPAGYDTTITTDANGATTVTPKTVTYPDPVSTKYKSWTGTANAGYGFDPARITRANIIAWGLGAATIADNAVTEPSTPLAPATGTRYGNASSAGIPNWVVARDFGPGTIGTLVPVSYAATDSTTVSTAEITLPYTYA
jgi:hypothetical protein